MAILETTATESKTGFRKRIDEESESVILNIVQVALYQFPFKSMIREIVSNAVDSNREKATARLIKTGSAAVSDFYIETEGDLYKDSKFNSDYYDLKYLSPSDQVHIDYHTNADYSARDLLTIRDNGVGLGGYRLEKFFSPGASTKRLNKQALGKYGIGNKSPLSTGIGVYRLISHYNGMQFIFDIFEDKIDSLVPKFKEDGEENPHILFENTLDMRGNPMKVYYIPSEEKNSVEIQVEIKKHNRNQIFEGVKSQLMYFRDDIIFTEHTGGQSRRIDFKTSILHEDDDLIVPANNGYYQRPHFILNNVCYGLIDFQELELNTRYGNIGIKVDPSEIDVSPSRESVTYSQKTKDTVLKKYEEIVKRVTALVDEELKAKDPIEWLRRANAIVLYSGGANSNNQLLNKLSNLIDKTQIKPVYSRDGVTFKYYQDLASMVTKHLPIDRVHVAGYGNNRSVKRATADNALAFDNPFYVQFENASSTKTAYLLSKHDNSFSLMKLDYEAAIKDAVVELIRGTQKVEDVLALADNFKDDTDKARFIRSINFLMFIKSSDHFKIYDDVVVPDSFENELRKNPDAVVIEISAAEKAKQRKEAGLITYATINKNGYGNNYTMPTVSASLDNLPENIWYGFNNDRDLIYNVATYLRLDSGKDIDTYDSDYSLIDKDTTVIKIAQSLKRQFKDHNHVDTFGYTIEDGVFKITSKTLKDIAKNLFLSNFDKKLESIDVKKLLMMLYQKEPKYLDFYIGFFKNNSNGLPFDKNTGLNLARISGAVDYLLEYYKITVMEEKELTEDEHRTLIEKHFDEEIADYIDSVELITKEEYLSILEIVDICQAYMADYKALFENNNAMYFKQGLFTKNSSGEYYMAIDDKYKMAQKYLPLLLNLGKDKLKYEHENLFKI